MFVLPMALILYNDDSENFVALPHTVRVRQVRGEDLRAGRSLPHRLRHAVRLPHHQRAHPLPAHHEDHRGLRDLQNDHDAAERARLLLLHHLRARLRPHQARPAQLLHAAPDCHRKHPARAARRLRPRSLPHRVPQPVPQQTADRTLCSPSATQKTTSSPSSSSESKTKSSSPKPKESRPSSKSSTAPSASSPSEPRRWRCRKKSTR